MYSIINTIRFTSGNYKVIEPSFKNMSNNYSRLLNKGFEKNVFGKGKYDYYLSKKVNNHEIMFFQESGLKNYLVKDNIKIYRNPDECYLIKKDNYNVLKIVENKSQFVEGTVDNKVYNAPYFLEEYRNFLGSKYYIEYAYCLSDFFKKKINNDEKWKFTYKYLRNNNVKVFFPSDNNYHRELDKWVEYHSK